MDTFHAVIRGVHRTLGRTQANIDRLARRVLLLAGRGRVSAPVNDAGVVQMMQVQINPLETIDNLRRIAEFGFTSVPPEGSDVAIVFVGGDRSSGLVIGTNHQGSRPTGLNPGETMIFTQDGKQIYLTASGGILKCTGDIIDNCNTTGRSMAADRQKYDAHGHPVVNVQPGSSTIVSGTPTVPE